jgi:regulatory protein
MPARPVKEPKSCHERALGLLAVRARSRHELESRLLAAGFQPDEVSEVLDRLERVGLVDDEAFARQLAEHRFGVKRMGVRAVSAELRSKGVAVAVIGSVVDGELPGDDARALDFARSRASRLGDLDAAKAFTRLSAALMRKGYSPEVARGAARRALDVEGEEL